MRAMWVAHGKPGGPSPGLVARPYTLGDARDRLAEVSGDRAFAVEFFEKYIEGREVPDYRRLFARAGLVLRKVNPGAAWSGVLDGGAGARRTGRRSAPTVAGPSSSGGVRIEGLVPWGTPAFQAGLDDGDVVTHADGKPVTGVEDWQAAVRAHQPGDQMPIEFTRRGAPMRTVVKLAEDPALEVVAVESTGGTLSTDQKAFRAAWLSSRKK
jgi:predicted metalloprotease with PDZ domain